MDTIYSKNKIKKEVIILNLVCLNLIQIILCVTIFLLMTSCAVPPDNWKDVTLEEYPPKWVIASTYLPKEKLQGLRGAGFFEIGNSIYSHHCDDHGNMIRMKYNEENNTWKQVKYETLGCGDPDA